MKPDETQRLRSLEAALRFVTDGVIIVDAQGYLVFMNDAAQKLLGESPLPEIPFTNQPERLNLYHTDGQAVQPGETLLGRALKGEDVKDGLLIVRRPDGRETYISGTATRITDEDGSLAGAVCLIQDVTEHREIQEALRASERKFQDFVMNSEDGIALMDEEGAIIEWNEGQEKITGLKRNEVLSKTMWDVQFQVAVQERRTPETYASLKSFILGLLSTAQWPRFGQLQEREIQRIDGARRTIQVSLFPIRTDKGFIFGSISRDITERKQAEERLLRAQRLEMAGRIAGQVAHDFNNLLSPLVSFPELIKMELPVNHPAIEYCDSMVRAAQQMAEINDDLLALSRRGHFSQQPTDINRLIEQTLAQMAPYPNTLVIQLELAPDPMRVSGSDAQLERVIANLVLNARDAMHDVGCLQISTDNTYIDKPFGAYNRVESGEYIRVRVSDSGSGIPAEVRDRIFDPFFTTKRTDRRRGSGLGLSIVQAIVSDHRGYIDVESEIEKGAVFTVYLPVCREPVQAKLVGSVTGGRETILVVDDEELQREVMGRLLQNQGYMVNAVSSGQEAVEYLMKNSVDLLILDMVMPDGIDGAETYRRVLQIKPDQKAIIVSGFAETDRVQETQGMGASAYLRKPVTLQKLAQAVRQELDRKTG